MAHVLTIPRESEVESQAEIAAIAQELGLAVQASRYSAPNRIETDLSPMSDDEILIWQYFCPTAYRSEYAEPARSLNNGSSRYYFMEYRWPMSQYSHDIIPAAVLSHWAEMKKRYAFDAFEIRTTEKRIVPNADPILLGYYSGKTYQLARWGLESPEALPLKEVAQKVKEDAEKAWPTFDAGIWFKDFRHPYRDSEVWHAADRILA